MLKDLFRRPRFALAKPVPGLWSGKIARDSCKACPAFSGSVGRRICCWGTQGAKERAATVSLNGIFIINSDYTVNSAFVTDARENKLGRLWQKVAWSKEDLELIQKNLN